MKGGNAAKKTNAINNCCNSLNFEAKINFNTTKQNDLKWRKTCTGLKFDLEYFNGPQTGCYIYNIYM